MYSGQTLSSIPSQSGKLLRTAIGCLLPIVNVFAIILLTVEKAALDEKTSAGLGFSRLLRSYMNC